MKTVKNIYSDIASFENLLMSAHQAAKGKKECEYVLKFFSKLEDHLHDLRNELVDQSYQPGEYSTFFIYEPKKRKISAAPFRDRVVHHALINIIGPILEKSFIYDSYANRKGKGTHRAIKRFQGYLRQFDYVLKCDLKKYFPTIDHQILKELIRRKISDKETLWLIDLIIDNSNPQEFVLDFFDGDSLFAPTERRKGLPIGNLTSQYFANYYLDGLDHFVKEKLQCPAYIRYVDDFCMFGNYKKQLWHWLHAIEKYVADLRLKLNPLRTILCPSHVGIPFLGQIVYRSHRRLPGKNVRKFYKKYLNLSESTQKKQSLAAWFGHAKQANTEGLRLNILKAVK